MRVLEGEIVRMKLYDVAEEIRLEALAPSMFEGRLPVRQPLSRAQIQSIELVRPPMVVELGERESSFETGRERVRLGARFYEVGVVALVAHFPVRDLPQENFIDRALKLDYDPRVDELLDRELRQILGVMGDAVVGAHDFEGFEEEFAFYVLRRTDRPIRRENLEEFPELVAMLHGESRSLSGQQTALLCENSLSFFENDLVVLNYDNALVVDDADPVTSCCWWSTPWPRCWRPATTTRPSTTSSGPSTGRWTRSPPSGRCSSPSATGNSPDGP